MTALGGDFNLPRVKRYLALVQQSGATPVIVVNKSDLKNDVVGSVGEIEGIGSDIPVHVISARARESIQVIEQYFTGNRTVAIIGCRQINADEPVARPRRAGNTRRSRLR